MKKIILVFTISAIFFHSACGPSSIDTETTDVSTVETVGNTNNTSYPAPSSTLNNTYPPPQQELEGYPVSTVVDESKRFIIEEPLKAGDTEITGTGPTNIPIKVINISLVGEALGSGVIDNDGTFHISLSSPLEVNHVIGLQLGDQSLEPSFLDGPDYTNIPMIGLVLTQAVVQP
jgi:hypothetical protein